MADQRDSLKREAAIFSILDAANLYHAITAINKIKDRSYASMTPEQLAIRAQVLNVALHLLESEVSNAMSSAVFLWTGEKIAPPSA